MSDKYAAITAHADRYPIRLMCAALGVSASGYYDARAREAAAPRPRALQRTRRQAMVRSHFYRCRQTYGAPRLVDELRDAGERITRKTVARLLREQGLAARRRRRFVVTTDSAHNAPIAPNHLARRFGVAAQTSCDRVWVGDMTYIPTRTGWLYLAVLPSVDTQIRPPVDT